jgi:predicted MFS family arabinose efflux permease
MTRTATSTDASSSPEVATIRNREEVQPAWGAIVSLSLGVFGLVTAEFLPASLLTPMAKDLSITDGAAGQAVTATALVGAMAAPTIAIVTRQLDRRIVMWALIVLLIISNILVASSTGLATLLSARVLLGVSLGGFWSMAPAMAMRLVPMRLMPRAMSIILTGVSFATVCAAPVGAYIGEIWGWRIAFLVASGVGGISLLALLLTLPNLPSVGTPGVRTLFELMKRSSVRVGLLAAILIVSGHFAGFTYVRPFLEQMPQLGVSAISLVLLAFGLSGFAGNFVGAFLAERSIPNTVILGALLVAVAALVLTIAGSSPTITAMAVAVWGFAFAFLPVGLQSWIIRAAPDQAESAGGLLVSVFQVAIASGAIFGGLLVDNFGALGAIAYCGVATFIGALVVQTLGKNALTQ